MKRGVPEEEGRKWKLLTVLVTAHPDDESMFFVPTLSSLIGERQQRSSPTKTSSSVWLLCLTTGNYNGLGCVRSHELRCAVAESILNIDHTILLDNDQFPDDPINPWDVSVVADAMQTALVDAILCHAAAQKGGSECLVSGGGGGVVVDRIRLVTFDEAGVSGHRNHRDTFRAVRELLMRTKKDPAAQHHLLHTCHVEAWSLQTIHNPITKYIPVGAWIQLLLSYCGFYEATSSLQRDTEWTFQLLRPSLNWKAMVTHRSQFVWYRRLFVVFSCYTYINLLRLIQLDEGEQSVNNGTLLRQQGQKKRD